MKDNFMILTENETIFKVRYAFLALACIKGLFKPLTFHMMIVMWYDSLD